MIGVCGVDGEGDCTPLIHLSVISSSSQFSNYESSLHDEVFDAIVGEGDCATGPFFLQEILRMKSVIF